MNNYLQHVSICNWQSHKDTKLDLVPGLNVIIGDTDQGKSAFLRSILWPITNRPLSDSFIRHGQKQAVVELKFADGINVQRKRSNTVNLYMLNDEEFSAPGTTVPDKIVKALNMTEFNWEKQRDPPFLLASTPGQVAEELNKAVNLDIIGFTLKRAQADLRRTESMLQVKNENEKRIQAELGEYEWLDDAKTILEQAEQLEIEISQIRQNKARVADLHKKLTLCMECIHNAQTRASMKQDVDAVHVLHRDIGEMRAEVMRLRDLWCRYRDLSNKIGHVKSVLEQKQKIKKAEKLYADMLGLKKKNNRFEVLLEKLRNNQIKLQTTEEQKQQKARELEEAKGNTCPTCGKEW